MSDLPLTVKLSLSFLALLMLVSLFLFTKETLIFIAVMGGTISVARLLIYFFEGE